jgi:DNA polymerase-3 subunit beta
MKATIPITTLKAALAATAPAVGRQGVTTAVLIRGGVMAATNGEIRIEVEFPSSDISCLLPHKRLQAITNAATGDEMTIEPKDAFQFGDLVKLTAGHGSWTLPTEDWQTFPAGIAGEARKIGTVEASVLADMLRSVLPCTDAESSRYALGAVLLEMADGSLHAVATDGRRLGAATTPAQAEDGTLLIPQAAASALVRLLESAASVSIRKTGSEAVFSADNGARLVARQIEGRFPKWREVIPKTEAAACIVDAGELLSAVRQASIVTSEQSKAVRFAFGEHIALTARSAEAGESRVRCDVVTAGPRCTVGLDPRFVAEFLKVVPAGETVSITAVDADTGCVLRAGRWVGVVMPMAVEA